MSSLGIYLHGMMVSNLFAFGFISALCLCEEFEMPKTRLPFRKWLENELCHLHVTSPPTQYCIQVLRLEVVITHFTTSCVPSLAHTASDKGLNVTALSDKSTVGQLLCQGPISDIWPLLYYYR